MAKFLFSVNFLQAGVQGAIKEGFAAREAYVRQFVEEQGAKVEAMYWAYGDHDVILVIDASQAAAVAISLAVNASGALKLTTTPLMTSVEMDDARGQMPNFRPPGA